MIAVISDSHIPRRAGKIPDRFAEELQKSVLNVHCGDFVSQDFKQELEQHGELIAVKGNCDHFKLPASEKFERSGIDFGVYHGTGIQPRGHLPTLVETARKLDVKALLTGHTHKQKAVKDKGKVILNPGSCTGAPGGSYSGGQPEMMKLYVEQGKIEAELIELINGEKASQKHGFKV